MRLAHDRASIALLIQFSLSPIFIVLVGCGVSPTTANLGYSGFGPSTLGTNPGVNNGDGVSNVSSSGGASTGVGVVVSISESNVSGDWQDIHGTTAKSTQSGESLTFTYTGRTDYGEISGGVITGSFAGTELTGSFDCNLMGASSSGSSTGSTNSATSDSSYSGPCPIVWTSSSGFNDIWFPEDWIRLLPAPVIAGQWHDAHGTAVTIGQTVNLLTFSFDGASCAGIYSGFNVITGYFGTTILIGTLSADGNSIVWTNPNDGSPNDTWTRG